MAYEQHKYIDPAKQYERSSSNLTDSQSQIESMINQVDEPLQKSNLASALKGEDGFLDRLAELGEPQKQIKFAERMLHDNSFIVKMIPSHITEENRAAFIVAASKRLVDPKFNL